MTEDFSDLSFVFAMPPRVVFGAGALAEAGPELQQLGVQRALLVSDAGVAAAGLLGRVQEALSGRVVATFCETPADSGVEAVEAARDMAVAAKADGVVSCGGGSVIDTAKAVALLLTEGGALRDHEGFQNMSGPAAPHLAIPTTAGTGSEVTYVAVIKDRAVGRKLLFGDHRLVPGAAILDPCLTVGLPTFLTAATGMDALSHAVEAMHALERQPWSDALAVRAIRMIHEALPVCIATPGNVAARGRQMLASCMAGAAFSNAQVGLCHAMAHTIGARFDVHHGLANAIFLPHVIRFNAPDCMDVYREVATAFGVDGSGGDPMVADRLAQAIAVFAQGLGLPAGLSGLGIAQDVLPELAEATLYDAALVYNARTVNDASEILPLWEAAWCC